MNRRRTSGRADAFFDEAPCGYLAATPDGTIRRVNRTLRTMTGFERRTSSSAAGRSPACSAPADASTSRRTWRLLLNGGAVRGVALELVHADGQRVPVSFGATLAPRRRAGRRCASPCFDATERRAYERELLAARARAEESEAQGPASSARCSRR